MKIAEIFSLGYGHHGHGGHYERHNGGRLLGILGH
jgi:hypothetical protein